MLGVDTESAGVVVGGSYCPGAIVVVAFSASIVEVTIALILAEPRTAGKALEIRGDRIQSDCKSSHTVDCSGTLARLVSVI